MGITDYEGLARKQELYRLALCLHVEFDVLVEMPLWEIRERAFFSGEQVMISRLQNIQDHHHALRISRSEKPGEQFEQIRKELENDVMVERLMDPNERKQRISEHNRAAVRQMMGDLNLPTVPSASSPKKPSPNLSRGERDKYGGN